MRLDDLIQKLQELVADGEPPEYSVKFVTESGAECQINDVRRSCDGVVLS